jgi:hypothetical protein
VNAEQFARKIDEILRRLDALEATAHINYSKGSFAPTLVGAGTAGTFTYGAGTLIEWTINGNRLRFNGRINITATAVAPVGNLSVNGWPYAGVADTNMAIAGVGSMEWRSVNLPANYWSISLQFSNGGSTAALVRSGTNNNFAVVQGGELAGGVYDFRFSGSYRVA